jgi:hypothetical protein
MDRRAGRATRCDDEGQYSTDAGSGGTPGSRAHKRRSPPLPPGRYDARVQEIELILVAAGVILSAAYIAAQARSRGTTDHIAVRLLLGLVPAAVAVAVVLINRFDMVPDDLEQNLWLLSVVVVSAVLIIGTGYRLARR